MKLTLSTVQHVEFDLMATPHLLDPANATLASWHTTTSSAQLVVLDDAVNNHAGAAVRKYFAARQIPIHLTVVPGGEESKCIEQMLELIRLFNDIGVRRTHNPMIVIGGGAVLDAVAAAASLYRRGVPYVRVPTTLLSMVDVGVAAKTGINFEGYRNRIGSFHPPVATLLDLDFLRTVTHQQVSYGLGEIAKLAIICDAELFAQMEAAPGDIAQQVLTKPAFAETLVWAAASQMLSQLEDNLWEQNLRRCVDFGHTFSPLIEMESKLHHGQAVALDCLFSSHLALNRGLITPDEAARVHRLISRCGLKTWHPFFSDPVRLLAALGDSTTHRNGAQHAPLPAGIGQHVFADDVSVAEIQAAARDFARQADSVGAGA